MRINPIIAKQNFVKNNFKGYMVEHAGEHDRVAAYNTGRRVEKGQTLYPVGKIYYADPLETVRDNIRQAADYIVYDDEPSFPDVNQEISKAFFHPEADNIGNNVKDIRRYQAYFYRMEMADRKKVGELENNIWRNQDVENSREKSAYYQARIADAQYNQKSAETFLNILNESSDLRKQNHENYDNIKHLEYLLERLEANAPKAKKEATYRTEIDSILSKKINTLKKEIKSCKELLNNNEKNIAIDKEGVDFSPAYQYYNYSFESNDSKQGYWRSTPSAYNDYEEIKSNFTKDLESNEETASLAQEILDDLTSQLDKYTNSQAKNKVELDFLNEYIRLLPQKLKNLKVNLEQAQSAFAKSKADLIPHFDKLKNYLANNGLRIVK